MRGWPGKRVLAGSAALVAAFIWAGSALAAPGPCASIMPLSDVARGQTGTGWTVVSGTDPESFDFEVLGIARDLVGPGRDVIVVRISGPVVDAGGGVWAGMSGSPMYIGGDLAGALAYGFSFGATDIAGLTPAEDMIRVGDLSVLRHTPARLKLSRGLVRRIAASTGKAVPTIGNSLVRLKLPVSVSGATRYRKVKRILRRHDVSFKITPGAAAAPSLAGTVDDLVPGGNFAAALSYGDITFAGVGTTTYVCDGKALAFGHPFLWTGRSTLGAGSADALAIIPDPLGPYKFANITDPLGKLDQDRRAGVRAVDGEPDSIPVTTAVTSLDNSAARTGETDVVSKPDLPDLAFIHIFSNIDSVFDAVGKGSASFTWTFQGTREDGSPWELHRSNMYASDFDISFESAFEMYDEMLQIADYPNENVQFTSVQASINLEDTPRTYKLRDVLYCRRGACNSVDEIHAAPGKTLKFRAILRPSGSSTDQTVNFALTIPPNARRGALVDVGGGCSLLFGDCPFLDPPKKFEWLLRRFQRQTPNNVLHAKLLTGNRGRLSDQANTVFDRVVAGNVFIPVFFPGDCCPPEGGFGGGGEFGF